MKGRLQLKPNQSTKCQEALKALYGSPMTQQEQAEHASKQAAQDEDAWARIRGNAEPDLFKQGKPA